MKTYMRKTIIIVFLVIGLSITSFSDFVCSEEPIASGLSLSDAHILYHTNSKTLQIRIVLLNTGSDHITVLTDGLDTEFLKDSNTLVISKGSMTVKYPGYNIVESLYKFAPVTLKPKEGTFVNHLVKGPFDANADLIVRYEIRENFGKRFNVWYGATESDPIKPRTIK